MIADYNSNIDIIYKSLLTSSPQGNIGDGIIMVQEVNAQIVDMEYIQLYPYANPATGIHYYMENNRVENGAFYINKNGERFTSEENIRSVLANNVLEQPEFTMYEILIKIY